MMLTLFKLIQSLFKALNSEGTPSQVAAGIALGSMFGLTPLLSLHNLMMIVVIFLFNVSVPGAIIGWLVFTPVGFALDPSFDSVGAFLLLDVPGLSPLWYAIAAIPVVPFTSFNNTVLLGSIVGWVMLAWPIFFLARWGVRTYRATLFERVQSMPLYRAVKASKVYNVYRLFRP
jgi:uncharacterized protein (TIGR03546 family)